MSSGEGLVLSDGVRLEDGTMLAAMVVGAALFLILLLVAARPWRDRHAVSGWSLGLFLGGLALTFTLLVPAFWAQRGGDPWIAIPQTIFAAVQSPTLNSGSADIVGGAATGPVSAAYYFLLSICYLAMPVLAVINVFDLIGRRFASLRFWFVCRFSVRRRSVYVFSGLGGRELSLAREIVEREGSGRGRAARGRRPLIIFTNVSRADRDEFTDRIADLDSSDARFLGEGFTATAARLCSGKNMRFSRCRFLAVSDDAARNVAKTCSALERIRGIGTGPDGAPNDPLPAFLKEGPGEDGRGRDQEERVLFYVRIDSPDDPVVLDAANSGGAARSLPLKTLQDESLAAISLLHRTPLYLALDQGPAGPSSLRPSAPQTLDVLVLGSGRLAEEVVLDVLWMGQMHNVRLRVTVADEGAEALRARLELRCRELMELNDEEGDGSGLFHLGFKSVALRSRHFYDEVLGPLADSPHLYVVTAVSRGDAANYELALAARLHLLDCRAQDGSRLADPVIAAYVRDPSMSRLIPDELDVGANSYGIRTFGAGLFGYDTILGTDLERQAQLTDELYGRLYELDTSSFVGPQVDPLAVRDAVTGLMRGRPSPDVPVGEVVSTKGFIIYQSNLAVALHADYKAWAMGLGRGVPGHPTGGPSEESIRQLACAEHNRWWCFYLTYGYSRLTERQRVCFSRRLSDGFGDRNRLRKIESLRKHALLCPHAELWDSYARSMSGFAYERRLSGHAGGVRPLMTVRCADGSSAMGMRVQLVTADGHLVADEWDVGEGAHACAPLPAGEYLLHPCRAVPGRQAGDDATVTVDAASDDAEVEAVIERTAPLVNTEVYDMAFVCAVWWERTRAV